MADRQVKGADLEQRVAAFFAANGYQVELNQRMPGRSGGVHEIDVLATKSDGVTTTRVAVECKAWAQAVAKETVTSFARS